MNKQRYNTIKLKVKKQWSSVFHLLFENSIYLYGSIPCYQLCYLVTESCKLLLFLKLPCSLCLKCVMTLLQKLFFMYFKIQKKVLCVYDWQRQYIQCWIIIDFKYNASGFFLSKAKKHIPAVVSANLNYF